MSNVSELSRIFISLNKSSVTNKLLIMLSQTWVGCKIEIILGLQNEVDSRDLLFPQESLRFFRNLSVQFKVTNFWDPNMRNKFENVIEFY